MSSNFISTENTFNFSKINNHIVHDQFNNIHLRDQFNIVFEELFKNSKKEENKNSNNFSTIKDNSSLEKRELEIKIAKEEKKINELEKLKKEKLLKV